MPTELPPEWTGHSSRALDEDLERRVALWVMFVTFFAVLILFLSSQVLQFLNLPLGLLATSLLVFGASGLVLSLAFNQQPAAFTRLASFPIVGVALAVVLGAVNLPLANTLMGAAQTLLPKSWSEMAEGSTRMLADATGAARMLLILAAAGAAPIGEELFFRGWLQGVARRARSGIWASVVVATLFSAVHLDPVGFVARLELGILFGLLCERTRSLWPAIAMHATHNGLSTAMIYFAPKEALEAEQKFTWSDAAPWATLSLIATVFVWRRFPRSAVTETTSPPLRWTPRRAAKWVALNALLLALATTLLSTFRHRLPGADLTKPQPTVSTPVNPPPGVNSQDGRRHLK